jgi:hypothetical protein
MPIEDYSGMVFMEDMSFQDEDSVYDFEENAPEGGDDEEDDE